MENFCNYYQACLERQKVVEIIGILKSFEHVCFDRTIDPQASIFEFFVPDDQEALFCAVMNYFEEQGSITELKKLPNRLIKEDVQ